MSDTIKRGFKTALGRRAFMKWSSLAGGSAAVLGSGLPFSLSASEKKAESTPEDKVVWSACTVNCSSRCPLRMHVSNDVITHVEADNTGSEEWGDHQVRACLRGRSMKQRVYHPDRLKYPMKRVGKRGEGRFKRISWDEALDIIAGSLKDIRSRYGNEAIYINYGTGTLGATVSKSFPHSATMIARLMNCYGGYLNYHNTYSSAQYTVGLPYTYGGSGWVSGNEISDLVNSKLLVMFGTNPAETDMGGGGHIYHLQQARERNPVRTISFDPRKNDTTVVSNDNEWVPLRPGTDAALIAGMAYVMITNDLVDMDFINRYTIGFDEDTLPASAPKGASWKSYILGNGPDKTPKTPEWAAKITGVPVHKIESLAREIATTKPCTITQGLGPQRHVNGEHTVRAIAMLSIMTGNVGIPGGGNGGSMSAYYMPFAGFPQLENPVKTSIPVFLWTDAIWRHEEMTSTTDGIQGSERLKAPLKFLWNYAGNCVLNQHGDINRTHEILQDENQCEMIVVIENHMTSSARYADILLPDLTTSEQFDFAYQVDAGNMGFVVCTQPAVSPMFECRGLYEVCADLAKRLGVEEAYTEGRNREQWLELIYANARQNNPELPSLQQFIKQGIVKQKRPGKPYVAFEAFRQDPEANPLATPSGKIEIYSERLAELASSWQLKNDEFIKPLPEYVSMWEGHESELAQKYPLQVYGFHYKARVHSTYGNVATIKDANRQEMWVNPVDAESRSIKDGDLMRVWNDRGELRVVAKVTPRIVPGVVAMGQGAWYSPNKDKVDLGACINTLTGQRPTSLAKANPQHSNLVNIEKA